MSSITIEPINKANTKNKDYGFPERLEEYNQIENLVLAYKKQFKEDASYEEIYKAKEAASILIEKFNPLMKKYLNSIQNTHIDFDDVDIKNFVLCFIKDKRLKKALRSEKQSSKIRHEIYRCFNFVAETYGKVGNEEIMADLQMLLLVLAKRYKPIGKNFCAYLYNTYRFEVSRHIQKFIKNPQNIYYKNIQYEDYMQTCNEDTIDGCFEDRLYEDNMGMPDMTWIAGISCSEAFQSLDPIERKILIKYYMEDYNDRQISDEFAIHINTCNQKRRHAILKLAKAMNLSESDIKRNRKSGKRALFF